ncbi:MAG TPA: hypothetical protein VK588_16750 [Chitinophagaceae bacterium]|nr:hypothetical protein [Chitinophagaceae bacterium]
MIDNLAELASLQPSSKIEEHNSFKQYLSFHFKENLDHITGITKDSINNFLKTISEIEDEFVTVLQGPRVNSLELQNFEFDSGQYMEENY